MLFGFDDNKRFENLLERRKSAKHGDSELKVGDLFTISFNLATGDRSYMNGIWRVLHSTPQKVYGEVVLNADKVEKPDGFLNIVGDRRIFDVGEYHFYDARGLHDLIVAERERSVVVSLCAANEVDAGPDGTGEAA